MRQVSIGTPSGKSGKFFMDTKALMRSRMLVQASSGGGKSWAVRKILEETHGEVQQIVLDVEDDFSTLREKFDYVLVGKGGDITADPRSADLLARKILELKVDVIINLYELKHRDRILFVKNFLDAMVNAPKELWHHVLVLLDEAHMFAPEKDKSESVGSVIDMASRGRKRGYCLIPATQRLSKLSKDVAAECQNKLIGLANIDIDRKRASEELGFSEREKILTLRDLEPGEFYAVGPAFARGVNKLRIGNVQTTHPEAGKTFKASKKPLPTKKVQQILSQLADLPKEAEEELRTKQDMVAKIKQLERELRDAQKNVKHEIQEVKVADPKLVKAELLALRKEIAFAVSAACTEFRENLEKIFVKAHIPPQQVMAAHNAKFDVRAIEFPVKNIVPAKKISTMIGPGMNARLKMPSPQVKPSFDTYGDGSKLGRCERAILKFLAMREGTSFSKVQIGAMTQYSPGSGGFNNALSKIAQSGLILRNGDNIQINPAAVAQVRDILGDEYTRPDADARIGWLSKLGKCEREIFKFLNENEGEAFPKDTLGERTGYSPGSGGFNNAISRLNTLGLIQRNGDSTISLNPEIVGL